MMYVRKVFSHLILFVLLEAILNLPEVVLHDLNSVALVLVVRFVALDVVLGLLDARLELFLLVVELVLKGQEVLIEWNTVSQKRFIAASLVLLVDLLVLEQLDRSLHRCNLPMQVENDVFPDGGLVHIGLLSRRQLLNLVSGLGQLRVTLEFPINDWSGSPFINIVVRRRKLHVARGWRSTATTSS